MAGESVPDTLMNPPNPPSLPLRRARTRSRWARDFPRAPPRSLSVEQAMPPAAPRGRQQPNPRKRSRSVARPRGSGVADGPPASGSGGGRGRWVCAGGGYGGFDFNWLANSSDSDDAPAAANETGASNPPSAWLSGCSSAFSACSCPCCNTALEGCPSAPS